MESFLCSRICEIINEVNRFLKKKAFRTTWNGIKTMFVKETNNCKFETNNEFGDNGLSVTSYLELCAIQFNFYSISHKHTFYTDVKRIEYIHANIYKLYLYNSLNYSRTLIASRLWFMSGQTHGWHHHY